MVMHQDIKDKTGKLTILNYFLTNFLITPLQKEIISADLIRLRGITRAVWLARSSGPT